MTPDQFNLAFCVFLLLSLSVQWLLSLRQIRWITQHRHEVPAGFGEYVSLSSHQQAADYTLAKTRFSLLTQTFNALLLVCWTVMGGLNELNEVIRTHLSPWGPLVYQLGLVVGVSLINGLLDLPFEWWSTFKIEQSFGFNRTTPALFISDRVKGVLIGAAIGLPLLSLLLWLVQIAGPQWWLWGFGVWAAFNLLLMVIFPIWIAPLFNKFTPLDDDQVKSRVQALMQKCGFKAQGFYVMDGSKRSAHANAYFTGLGKSKRVVFFDTLLKKLTPDEVDAVLAHELGHFKYRHITQRMVLMLASSFLGFALLGWIMQQEWFYLGLGVVPNITQPNTALAMMLLMMVAPLLSLFSSPMGSYWSRRHEFQADAYACQQSSGLSLQNALLKLYADNSSTLTPDPWYVAFHYSHPPAIQRLAALKEQTA